MKFKRSVIIMMMLFLLGSCSLMPNKANEKSRRKHQHTCRYRITRGKVIRLITEKRQGNLRISTGNKSFKGSSNILSKNTIWISPSIIYTTQLTRQLFLFNPKKIRNSTLPSSLELIWKTKRLAM